MTKSTIILADFSDKSRFALIDEAFLAVTADEFILTSHIDESEHRVDRVEWLKELRLENFKDALYTTEDIIIGGRIIAGSEEHMMMLQTLSKVELADVYSACKENLKDHV
jgi:hypothetical protein